MSKASNGMLALGIVFLLGGILFVYLAYFVYPEYFLGFLIIPGAPTHLLPLIISLLLPLTLIFFGSATIYGGLRGEPVLKKGKTKRAPPPSPPEPPQKCPTCGQPLNFIRQHSKWYCSTCGEYS